MKYFITSDPHSFYTPLKQSLKNVRYDKNNPNHTLVILGDLFDRGEETKELYNFLTSIPEDRLILVKGNHEYLLEELLNKSFPESYDFSNGTVRTCCQMAYSSKHIAKKNEMILKDLEFDVTYGSIFSDKTDNSDDKFAIRKWKQIVKRVKNSDIYNWFRNIKWKHYFELDKFIAVHSFVPVKFNNNCHFTKQSEFNAIYNGWVNCMESDLNWRNANERSWELATWGCPYVYLEAKLFSENKTLICGHYTADEFHRHYDSNYNERNFKMYYDKNIIALDGTTAWSRITNILVINEDGSCYDQFNNKLNI